jgi:CRP/FNR family transcriptional regulator
LVEEIIVESVLSVVEKGTIIMRAGQYLKQLPILLEGNVKVYTQNDEKELLLYFIQPSQSCIISFYAAINNHPSRIIAVTEKESTILLVPAHIINDWISKYPGFNRLFFDLYHARYLDLLETINQLIFNKMDDRILHYLRTMQLREKTEFLEVSHHQIARDLGTAR